LKRKKVVHMRHIRRVRRHLRIALADQFGVHEQAVFGPVDVGQRAAVSVDPLDVVDEAESGPKPQ
jgi:hypothetical protein